MPRIKPLPQMPESPYYPLNLRGIFNGGLNTEDDPVEALKDNESPDMQNVEITAVGNIRKRKGYSELGTVTGTDANLGMHRYDKNDGATRVYLKSYDDKVAKWTGSTWTDIKTLSTGGVAMESAVANNLIYFTNGTDTVFKWDGTTATDVAAVPTGKYIDHIHNRFVVAGKSSNPSRLYFSDVADYETWGATSYLDIDLDAGGIITGVKVAQDRVFIFKSNGVYTWDGIATISSSVVKVANKGCVSHRSIVVLPDETLMYLAQDGIYNLAYSFGATKLSQKIQPTFEAFESDLFSNACGVYYNNKYWLAFTGDNGTYNDTVLAFDLRHGAWIRHTGINANDFIVTLDSDEKERLWWGNSNSNSKTYQNLIAEANASYSDAGTAITAYYITKGYDMGKPNIYKKIKKLYYSFKAASDWNLTLGARGVIGGGWNEWNVNLDGDAIDWATGADDWGDSGISWGISNKRIEGYLDNFSLERSRFTQFRFYNAGDQESFTVYSIVPHYMYKNNFI